MMLMKYDWRKPSATVCVHADIKGYGLRQTGRAVKKDRTVASTLLATRHTHAHVANALPRHLLGTPLSVFIPAEAVLLSATRLAQGAQRMSRAYPGVCIV